MDTEILVKSILSATVLLVVLLAFKNVYYTCVVSSACWSALKKINDEIGFTPKRRPTLNGIIKWLVFWPILLPAKIHGHGEAEAQICNDVIAIAIPSGVCGDPRFCASTAGEGLAEVMTEESSDYSFSMVDLKIDEEEDLVLCVFKRTKKGEQK